MPLPRMNAHLCSGASVDSGPIQEYTLHEAIRMFPIALCLKALNRRAATDALVKGKLEYLIASPSRNYKKWMFQFKWELMLWTII